MNKNKPKILLTLLIGKTTTVISIAYSLFGLLFYIKNLNKYILQKQNHTVKVTQLCLTLCNPKDCTVHGIL